MRGGGTSISWMGPALCCLPEGKSVWGPDERYPLQLFYRVRLLNRSESEVIDAMSKNKSCFYRTPDGVCVKRE